MHHKPSWDKYVISCSILLLLSNILLFFSGSIKQEDIFENVTLQKIFQSFSITFKIVINWWLETLPRPWSIFSYIATSSAQEPHSRFHYRVLGVASPLHMPLGMSCIQKMFLSKWQVWSHRGFPAILPPVGLVTCYNAQPVLK